MTMDDKRPLSEWTLGELQLHCKRVECRKCFVAEMFGGACNFEDLPPCSWGLTDPPRWTQDDVEDAKAIKRIYPYATRVERYTADGMIKLICRGSYYTGYSHLLPSLALGECVDLQEILDADLQAAKIAMEDCLR